MITLEHVSVSVGTKEILHDISYRFKKNTVYAIMGPNGSGKSTLAYAIMGHPGYQISAKGSIRIGTREISTLSADKRSQAGIFLSFQSPLALTGVSVYQLLHVALKGKKDPIHIRKEVQALARTLHIHPDLLQRPLNEGASGGEKKKLELLQAMVLEKQFLMFDEIDTGVDIDALRDMATFLNKEKEKKTYFLITHYNRILKYIRPDKVLVMVNGSIVDEGDYTLAHSIEQNGYAAYSSQ